jgi:NDP-sugar pyrophosphorylase family protein
MIALILCGGLGTRLRSLHPDLPKALVPVRGRPFLAWMLAWLRGQGVTRAHLAAGYRADQIAAWAHSASLPGLDLSVSVEPAPLGTGGGLRFGAKQAAGDVLLVLNGDSFLPSLHLDALVAQHRASPSATVLAVTRIEAAGRYGTVEFDDTCRITAFREKADRNDGWVNGGVYVMPRSVVERIPEDRPSSLEQDLFPRLAAAGLLAAHPTPPPLLDMGTPEGLAAMETHLAGHPIA